MQDCETCVTICASIQITKYYKDGVYVGNHVLNMNSKENEYWYDAEERLHSFDDKPALKYVANGLIIHKWYKNGLLHREDGPASVQYENGKIIGQYWYKDNKRYRKTGPSCIYYKYYNIRANEWMKNDYLLIPYKNVPEASRLPPSLRAAMLVLPLPIGNEILHQCEWIWPFE